MPTTVETFEQLIRYHTAQELVPLLEQLDKKEVVAVRARTKALHKEFDEYKRRDDGQWSRLMRPAQEVMLFLAGLATYSRKEALTGRFAIPWQFFRNYREEDEAQTAEHRRLFMRVLDHARPDWLGDWLARNSRANDWATMEYPVLRELESRGLLAHQPLLYAHSLALLLHMHNQQRNSRQGQAQHEYYRQVLLALQADATLLHRDLPLLFDFDTAVDSAAVYHEDYTVSTSWLTLLPQLVASGHLDRAELLTRSLLALRRDFRRPLLTWFKNLFLALQPTVAERLARQGELVELLAHPLPQVVNFALDQLKDLWADPAFNVEALLLYADGLMTRPDLKTGIKTLLMGFGKLLKSQPAQAPALARLYTAALSHADTAIQERAAKGLADLLKARPPRLSGAETEETIGSIALYADLLAPAARAVLAPWLSPPETPAALANPAGPMAAYVPRPDFTPELSEATAVVPVADWHELLFLTGPVLLHDASAPLERWLEGLLRLRPQFPADCREPLQPYLLQLMPYLKGRSAAEVAAVYDNPSLAEGYPGLIQALLLGWATGFARPLVGKVSSQTTYYHSDPLVTVEQHRLAFAEELLRNRRALPLLSTPTHAPHWVAPTALLQRLQAYEAAGQEPNPADLAVALARTVYTHAAETAAARALLPGLFHEGLRGLLGWLLSPAGTPLPPEATEHKSRLRQFTERLGKLLPRSAAALSANLTEALPWLWAVAARTRQPAAEYPALANLTAASCPGVVRPWQPQWALRPQSHTYVEQWKPGKPEVTTHWVELQLEPEPTAGVTPSALLLYSLHAGFRMEEKSRIWQYLPPVAENFPFLLALLPQHPAPLYWHVVRLAATRDTVDSSTRDLLSQTLRTLLGPGPAFDKPVTLVLAVSLTHNAAACRALALEVLLAAVAQQRLEPTALGHALGQLLAAGFVPVQRLADGLAQARAIDSATDDALHQLLDALLPELPAEPPRNVRKLLEAYADFSSRTQRPVPADVQARLREWSSSGSLRKVASALLGGE